MLCGTATTGEKKGGGGRVDRCNVANRVLKFGVSIFCKWKRTSEVLLRLYISFHVLRKAAFTKPALFLT